MADDPALPPLLLSGLAWSFQQPRYEDLPSFVRAVERFHAEARGAPPPWVPDAVLLPVPALRVRHEEEGAEVVLHSPGGGAFTAAGLLLALHEALRGPLEEAPDPFLHEVALVEPAQPLRPPLYEIRTACWLGTAAERPRGPLPREVLKHLPWCLTEPRPEDLARFGEQVKLYEAELRPPERCVWDPGALVLPAPVIMVSYWMARHGEDRSIVLRSAGAEGFTAVDLLHQIHGDAAPRLADDDHQFFEGLTLAQEPTPAMPPVYALRLGS